MMRVVHHLLPIVVGMMLLLTAAVPREVASAAAAETEPGESIAPITFFNANCASCHGKYGSFWGEGFAADYGRAELAGVVREMTEGPGFAPIDGAEFDAQVAYNAAMSTAGREQGPFLFVERFSDGLRGEVFPGSKVTVHVDGAEHEANVEGHTWRLVDAATATRVTAVLDESKTVLDVTKKVVWSHAASPPATQPR